MAGGLVFAVSYAFYIFIFLKSGVQAIYPLYLAPFAVLILVCAYSVMLGRLEDKKFLKVFPGLLNTAGVFALLFLTPVFIKLNLPDPHNFLQRKLEIILGVSYALYIILLTILMLRRAAKKITGGSLDTKQTFMFISVFFFTFYFALSLWFNYANQPTGDEPHYLIATHSMVYDRDIDLKNNYDNKDYAGFYTGRELEPELQDVRRGGKILPFHPVFFSLVLAPFYSLSGRLGATITVNIAAALIPAFIFMLLNRTFSVTTSVLTAFITGLSLPLLAFSNQLATEVTSCLFILTAYFMIRQNPKKVIEVSILMALIPWLHVRNLPVYLSLGLILLFSNRKNLKNIILFLVIQAAAFAVYFVFNFLAYGTPVIKYAAENEPFTALFNNTNIIKAAAGIFYDQEFGLFTYTPVFCVMFSGLYFLYNKEKRFFYEILLMFLPYFALIMAWVDWRGGGGSSPRFLVPVVFVFSVLTAAVLDRAKDRAVQSALKCLISAGFIMSAFIMFIPWFRWNKGSGENWAFQLISRFSHLPFSRMFPSFWAPGGGNTAVLLTWIMITGALNYFIFIRSKA